LSEAVQCGLPVVVTRNRRTMPQERFNTDWVSQQGVGVVIKRYADLPRGLLTLFEQMTHIRARVAALRNNAAREVTALMADALAQAASVNGHTPAAWAPQSHA
jgi:1,2-diacylglycerol 3-beta-galactosyltransferase